ncbi:kinase-like domain-containing protein [Gongronella butleri]|nr:kinase-like domain-containing protein [Gongronella butleri]
MKPSASLMWSAPAALLKRYMLGDVLGKGGHGFVVSCVDRLTGAACAVKFIYKAKIPATGWVALRSGTSNACDDDRTASLAPLTPLPLSAVPPCHSPSCDNAATTMHLPTEIHVLQQTQHPNIIRLLNVYQDDYFYYLVTETHGANWSLPTSSHANAHPPPLYTQAQQPTVPRSIQLHTQPPQNDTKHPKPAKKEGARDLFECIEHYGHFSEHVARHIFSQLLDALLYLKKKGIYHRDIKDENILIDDKFHVKLIDFGSAIRFQAQKQTWLGQFHGTLSFASPEILKGLAYEPEPAEVWSLGVLLYILLYGQVPFSNPLQVIQGQCHASTIHASKSCLHLIYSMFRKNPRHRPSFEQIKNHPWFTLDLDNE